MKSIFVVGVDISASKKLVLVDVLQGEERDRGGGEKEKRKDRG